MAAACPPKNCEKMKAAPVRDSGRRKASKACPWSMITAASPRSQSRNTMRLVLVECICRFFVDGLTLQQLQMRKERARLLPLHLNKTDSGERLAQIHRHGGFRPNHREPAPRFFSGLA